MKKIYVQLSGGLGNNLFQISAGIAHSKQFGKRIVLKKPVNHQSKFSHDFDASLFLNFEFENGQSSEKSVSRKLLSRLDNKLLRTSELYQQVRGIDFPRNYGFSNRILSDNSIKEIRGYYQSYKYFDLFRNEMLEMLSFGVEQGLLEKFPYDNLNFEKSAFIHVRGGDYKFLANEFGMLSGSYYNKAIETLEVEFGVSEFWVFSDDLNYAKKLFKARLENIKFVEVPRDSTPSDSLRFMSKFSYQIIANSTYSWWAAALSNNSKATIFPEPWFKNYKLEDSLNFPHWIPIEAKWIG
jgi:Glycosyl transferase family 11